VLFNKEKKEHTNPDGLTQNQFIEKYKDIEKIAEICWYFGVKPEELKEELKTLFDKY